MYFVDSMSGYHLSASPCMPLSEALRRLLGRGRAMKATAATKEHEVIRLWSDITECPDCRRPNLVLRVAGAIHRVMMRRTLDGADRHSCRQQRRSA